MQKCLRKQPNLKKLHNDKALILAFMNFFDDVSTYFQVKGFSHALYQSTLMLNGISNGDFKVEDIDKTITSDSSDKFEQSVLFTAYATLVLGFILLTIALTNILIGLSLNIAAEGLKEAQYQRLSAMAYNLLSILQLQ